MKNRAPLIVKIGIAFACLYLVYSSAFFVYQLFGSYDESRQQAYRHASNALAMGEIFLSAADQPGRVQDLAARLDDAMEAREIDYYLIRKGEKDLFYANAAGVDDPLVFPREDRDMTFETSSYQHFIKHVGPYYLAVGRKTSFSAYVQRFFARERSAFVKDLCFVILLVLSLVFFSLRDLRRVLKGLRRPSANRSASVAPKSAETLTLVQGLRGFEESNARLDQENRVLKGQVLPALQRELFSGRQPPYEFDCTLVRIDINGFTEVFSSPLRVTFMGVINEFFTRVAHVASSYQGYVYEYIGDEVLLYFRDEDHANSAAIALSAARDIAVLADEFHEKTTETYGFSFRVKASLACGTLRFGPLVNGFSLAGNPLIETVRMLSHVHEKSANTILFSSDVRERVSEICLSRELGVVMLKGLQNSRRLFVYEHHVPLNHHLRQGDSASLARAINYRAVGEICEILVFLRTDFDALAIENVNVLLRGLRVCRLTLETPEVRAAYVELLRALLARAPEEKALRVLASFLTTASALFPPQSFRGALREFVLECASMALPASAERRPQRVVANAVDVFTELDPSAADQVFEKLMKESDNRIAANVLIKRARQKWDVKTLRALRSLLKTGSPYSKASALYALGEICREIAARDPVAFRADLKLQDFIQESLSYLLHANAMVRRQAYQAAMKCGLEAQLEDMKRQGLWREESVKLAA